MADAQGNRYGPYDIDVAGSEAEAFTESAWHDAMAFLSGVMSGADLTFAGLTATLSATPSVPLHVWSHGGYIIRTDPWSVASPATPSGGNPRRDMIVARRQRTSGEGAGATPGKTFLTLLQGTPAASPADPTFDEDDDEPLWSWQVPGNGGSVVTDVRDLRRFLRAGGGHAPRLIVEDPIADIVGGGTAASGAGYVLVAQLAVPAHRPGWLSCRFKGAWAASANSAAFTKLQFPAGTDVPGSTHRGRNNGVANVPVAVDCDGSIRTDGTARTLGVYLSTDAAGAGTTLVSGSFQVWQS